MPAPLPLILLPPSEGKTPGGNGPPWSTGTMAVDLDAERTRVAAGLRRAMRANAAARSKLLGVKGVALAAATDADRSLMVAPTMPAIERYSGVLYGALDVASMDGAARRMLDASVLIVSGLWGLVAPTDPIPDYKLKMGSSLPGLGRLSTWWRSRIDAELAAILGAAPDRGPVWNLLPQEHGAAWSGVDDRDVVSVAFMEPGRSGELVSVSHWNKFLKGALVRFLVANPAVGIDGLAAWEHPSGYVLDDRLTVRDRNRVKLQLVKRP